MENSKPSLSTYTKKERNMYLIGLLGQNIIYNVISAALAYYLQFTLLIPAIIVSVIMTGARVWDAFNDPMMGSIVDKTRTKWGKCRPYLLFVPIPVFLVTMFCFFNGFFDPSMGMFEGKNAIVIIWAAVSYIMWGMTYTIGDIPLWGITALMTQNPDDRNKLLSYARIFGGIGGGITLLAIQPLSLKIGEMMAERMGSPAQGERVGFILGALIFSLVGTALFQLAGLFTKERITASNESYTLKQNFKIAIKNKPFRQIMLSGLLGSPKQLLALAAMPLVTYYYASKNPTMAVVYMALLGGGVFIGQFVSMALVPKLLTKFSKKNLYNYSNLLSVIPYVSIFIMYLIAPQNLVDPKYLVISFFLFTAGGATMGITLVLQSLMIADSVDYEEYTNGIRPDAVFFSGQSFITKLTTGIATIISGIAYAAVGFSDANIEKLNAFIADGGVPRVEAEYSSYMLVLFFLVSIPPAIGCLLSVIPTWRYVLDDKEHKRIVGELNIRRQNSGEEQLLNTDLEAKAINSDYEIKSDDLSNKKE